MAGPKVRRVAASFPGAASMPNHPLAEDVTLLTIRDRLADPEGYVRSVFERLWNCEPENGETLVRISIASGEAAPDYILETIMDPETGGCATMAAYSGKRHLPLAFATVDNYKIWSNKAVGIKEVAELLGNIRKFSVPRGWIGPAGERRESQ